MTSTLAILHAYVAENEPMARRHGLEARRVTRLCCETAARIQGGFDDGSLARLVRIEYRRKYGMPIIGAILLQIFISILVKAIVAWITKWWEENQASNPIDAALAVGNLLTALATEAEAEPDE